MPISTKGEYAARALLHLALAYGEGSPVKTAQIASEQKIPKKYLEQILLLFKTQGLVESKPGRNGGYSLARDPSQITMAQVVRTVDGPLAPMLCVSKTAYARCTCVVEATCPLRTVWQEARDAMARVLEGITLEDVAERGRSLAQVGAPTYSV